MHACYAEKNLNDFVVKSNSKNVFAYFHFHTAGSDTIFVQIYMDPPPGVPGVSNGAPGPLNMVFEVWCTNIAPKIKKI